MSLTRDDIIDLLTADTPGTYRKVGETDIAFWSATLRPDLHRELAFEALRIHYIHSTDRVMPAHINQLAVQIRKDRAERESATMREARQASNDRRNGLVSGDPQLGGLPIGGANGNPVWAAYEVNDAIERECPTCGQPAEHACINPITNSARKIPCLSRVKVAP